MDLNSTPINYIKDQDEEEESEFMEASTADQVFFLREYLHDFPSKGIELLSHFDRKYRCSGVSSLRNILESVCVSDGFRGELKLIAADALLSFKEDLEEVDDGSEDEDNTRACNQQIVKRNKMRVTRGVFSLGAVVDYICTSDANDVSTILKFDAIVRLHKLAESETNTEEIKSKCEANMKRLISNKSVESQYRLKLISRIPCDALKKECFIFFLGDVGNPTSMRIIAAQGILSTVENKYESDVYDVVMAQIEIFAKDRELDAFIRADAADVILGYGTEELQAQARIIINQIGLERGYGIYANTQNVHADSVDESIRASLDTLNEWRSKHTDLVKSFEDTVDDFNTRKNAVERTQEEIRDTETALFRILMGTRSYNGFTPQSLFCTVHAWVSSRRETERAELWTRLDQEMADMVNTCTTGIVSRLVNVLSGWGGFQIKISFKDQIKSNFAGRLNAVARQLVEHAEDGKHAFYELRKNEVALVYINDVLKRQCETDHKAEENEALLAAMADRGIDANGKEKEVSRVQYAVKRLQQSKPEKIASFEKECPELHLLARQHFADRLFIEFSIEEPNRKCFHLFFGHSFSKVAEELRKEFSGFMDPNDFEMCMRDALSFYEGS
jgi:hypothetical protein